MTSDDSSDHVTDALPPLLARRPRPTCPSCGSDDLINGLPFVASPEVGGVGIKYKSGSFLGMAIMSYEPLLIDLCSSCGNVARFYVKNVERDWHR